MSIAYYVYFSILAFTPLLLLFFHLAGSLITAPFILSGAIPSEYIVMIRISYFIFRLSFCSTIGTTVVAEVMY